MGTESDRDRTADPASIRRAEREAEHAIDDLAARTEDLGEHIEEARSDWERKQRDPDVPGAPAPDDEAQDEPGPDAADEEG